MTCARVWTKFLMPIRIYKTSLQWSFGLCLIKFVPSARSSFPKYLAGMILRRRLIEFQWLLTLLVTVFLFNGVSSIAGINGSSSLLKHLRRKGQSFVRYGTPNPEIHLTPVRMLNLFLGHDKLINKWFSYSYNTAANHREERLSSGDPSSHNGWWIHFRNPSHSGWKIQRSQQQESRFPPARRRWIVGNLARQSFKSIPTYLNQ